jgi:hypothetical protein
LVGQGSPLGIIGSRLALAVCCVSLAAAAAPPAAGAEDFFAAPGGDKEFCTSTLPCQLETALKAAGDGDAVRLADGDYVLPVGGIAIDADIDLGGAPGLGAALLAPEISSVDVAPGAEARIHDLRLEGETGLRLGSSTAERIFVSSEYDDYDACSLDAGATLRNSVCWGHPLEVKTKGTFHAIGIRTEGEGDDEPVVLRNVTAYTSALEGNAIYAKAIFQSKLHVEATNVIARSHRDVDVVARWDEVAGTESIIELRRSNYGTFRDGPTDMALVTEPQENENQAASPLFADASDGNFHMTAGSPTTDQGLPDPTAGPIDLEARDRTQAACLGGAELIDIGAYERPTEDCGTPPPPPPAVKPVKRVFRVVSVKLNKKSGGGQVYVEVPGPGIVALAGSGVKLVRRNGPAEGGMVALPIQLWAVTRVALARSGKARVRLNLTYDGRNDGFASWSKLVVLRKKRH